MKPTVGRIVHYQSYGTPGGEYKSEPRAAIITAVQEYDPLNPVAKLDDELSYRVSLFIANPTGVFFNENVTFNAEGKPGCWRWPPRD